MWEEEAWYQKQQAKTIGVLLLLLLVLYVVYFIVDRDWDYLKNLLLLLRSLIVVLGLFVVSVWALLKFFIPQRGSETDVEGKHE